MAKSVGMALSALLPRELVWKKAEADTPLGDEEVNVFPLDDDVAPFEENLFEDPALPKPEACPKPEFPDDP